MFVSFTLTCIYPNEYLYSDANLVGRETIVLTVELIMDVRMAIVKHHGNVFVKGSGQEESVMLVRTMNMSEL